MLTKRGESLFATPLQAVLHKVTVVIKPQDGLGKEQKRKEMVISENMETYFTPRRSLILIVFLLKTL